VTAISLIEQIPKVKLLTGEQYREFVPSPEEEAKFLAFAPEPLKSVATLPTQVYARKSAIGWNS